MKKMHYQPTIKRKRISKIGYFVMAGTALVIAGALFYFVMKYYGISNSPAAVPFIKAEYDYPLKIKPDQSLNPRLPHADKLIYNEMGNQAVVEDESKQNMLALPEDPVIYKEEIMPPPVEENNINAINISD